MVATSEYNLKEDASYFGLQDLEEMRLIAKVQDESQPDFPRCDGCYVIHGGLNRLSVYDALSFRNDGTLSAKV